MLRCSQWKCEAAIKPPTRPAPAVEPSQTSVLAAQSVEGRERHRGQAMVYQALKDMPDGLTDEGIQDITGLPGNTERPRRGDLVAQNVVVDSGRTRLTRANREAVVWMLRTEEKT